MAARWPLPTKNKKLETKEIDLMSNILYTYLKELKDDLIKIISNTIMNQELCLI